MNPPVKPKMITVRMSSEERELAKELAHQKRTSVNDMIRDLILSKAVESRDKTVQRLLESVKFRENCR